MLKRLASTGLIGLATIVPFDLGGFTCEPEPPPPPQDAGLDVGATDAAPTDGGATGDAGVAPDGATSDSGPVTEAGADAAVGVTVTGPIASLPSVACNAVPSQSTFTVTNPTDTTLTWSASIVAFSGGVAPTIVPSTSILAPGDSVTAVISYPVISVAGSEEFTLTVSDAVSAPQVFQIEEEVLGFEASATNLNFGALTWAPSGTPPIIAEQTETVALTIPFFISEQLPNNCELFTVIGGATTSPSVTFAESGCGNAITGADFTVQLVASAQTNPDGGSPILPIGTFVGTFSIGGDSATFGPLCNPSVTFTATVTLVAPNEDAGA